MISPVLVDSSVAREKGIASSDWGGEIFDFPILLVHAAVTYFHAFGTLFIHKVFLMSHQFSEGEC